MKRTGLLLITLCAATVGAEEVTLEPIVQRFFAAANASDAPGLLACFTDDAVVRIVSMEFRGKKAILGFFQRDVWGGVYTVEKTVKRPSGEEVSLLFQPQGWTQPEPPILYRFTLTGSRIERLEGVYR